MGNSVKICATFVWKSHLFMSYVLHPPGPTLLVQMSLSSLNYISVSSPVVVWCPLNWFTNSHILHSLHSSLLNIMQLQSALKTHHFFPHKMPPYPNPLSCLFSPALACLSSIYCTASYSLCFPSSFFFFGNKQIQQHGAPSPAPSSPPPRSFSTDR